MSTSTTPRSSTASASTPPPLPPPPTPLIFAISALSVEYVHGVIYMLEIKSAREIYSYIAI